MTPSFAVTPFLKQPSCQEEKRETNRRPTDPDGMNDLSNN
jgi:hypothetical protein